MTAASFNRPGAVDLSGLKARAAAPASAGGAGGGPGGAYVTDVNDIAEFEGVLRKSLQHPVVVEFHSPRAQGAGQLSADLASLADEYAGKFLLVRVDATAAPDIAQALGVQAVPTVVAVIGGQLAPLFQGVQPKENVRKVLDQVLQAAAANGVMGKADPVGQPAGAAEDEQPAADPRFAAADAALERGDFAAARDEFDKVLTATPNDAEALAGRAQAGLLDRSSKLDGSEVVRADAEPSNVEAQLAAADAELVGGNSEAAFARLVDAVRVTSGDERETVRLRLLELFETLGNSDPTVLKYRRKLATALF
ncbi:co-chaperone YbbN [Enemella dayhoffiae]|uniref:Co-chaperone YbbN n=1 Tax=Enemella dayhoffiae TaxID=2016507 RepID=A0A255GWT1_9ACTN|nr:tetratricopeptide repeat protein [Enemella dayhoffiae]OYO19293.1 co-chaperone YbbN [Enemella dayhoffiae]